MIVLHENNKMIFYLFIHLVSRTKLFWCSYDLHHIINDNNKDDGSTINK